MQPSASDGAVQSAAQLPGLVAGQLLEQPALQLPLQPPFQPEPEPALQPALQAPPQAPFHAPLQPSLQGTAGAQTAGQLSLPPAQQLPDHLGPDDADVESESETDASPTRPLEKGVVDIPRGLPAPCSAEERKRAENFLSAFQQGMTRKGRELPAGFTAAPYAWDRVQSRAQFILTRH